jgi:hypothetical protein
MPPSISRQDQLNPSSSVHDQAEYEQHQEHHEEDLGDAGKRHGYAAKTQDCRDERDHCEYDCVMKHFFPSTIASASSGPMRSGGRADLY